MARGSVGIKDVARLAGVSVGTVSNVLNNRELVSSERRELVEAAIAELGYVPNSVARQLKAGVSLAVGMIVLDTENPFYASVARGVESAAERNGTAVFVGNSRWDSERESQYLSLFEQQRLCGILVTPSQTGFGEVTEIARRGTPVVLVDAQGAVDGMCAVGANDYLGGFLAMRHLIEQGRRRIVIVGGPGNVHQTKERTRGALEAASAAGVSVSMVQTSEMTILEGRASGGRIAEYPPHERPDAVFALNDLLATGVLQALVMQRSIRVPEEIALVGYDDIDFCQSAVVPISSIRQPARDMGKVAYDLLEMELEQADHQHQFQLLAPELIVRESTVGVNAS